MNMPNRPSLADMAKAAKPKDSNTQKDIDLNAVEALSEKNDFTKREPEEPLRARNEYPDPFSTRMRAGMKDIIEDIVFTKKVTQQQVFERAILAYLEKEGLMETIVKYNKIVKE